MQRTIFDLAVFVTLLFAPFWITAALALFGVLCFPRWWEILALAALADPLYGGGAFFTEDTVSAMLPLVTLAALGALFIAELLRSMLRDAR